MSEWKPIETVPKDGSMVICFVNAVRLMESDEGYMYEMDASYIDFGQWVDSELGGYFINFASPNADIEDPTHWMPLPEPPKYED